tara:strand:- start:523 stop:1050 length:528 start_codon:yes stop_codon:yes gene_type:complete
MYLLNIDKRGQAIETDDSLYAIEEFRQVVEEHGLKGVLWVALVCDYDSPYRHFVERERVKSVSKAVFDKFEWKGSKSQSIANAILKYRELQFDPLDAQLIAFNEKIDEYTRLMRTVTITEDNAESMQKIMIGIEKVLNTRQKLLDAIERRGERKKIKGAAKMSYLEQQMNIKSKI